MKKTILFGVLLLALLLSAANPWNAKLTVLNYTEDNVFIQLLYRSQPQYFLTATVQGNTTEYHKSLFDVSRKKYDTKVTACGVTVEGTMDLNSNLKLVFTECLKMIQYLHPQYWAEPGFEKPNFYHQFEWVNWKFQYEVPVIYED